LKNSRKTKQNQAFLLSKFIDKITKI